MSNYYLEQLIAAGFTGKHYLTVILIYLLYVKLNTFFEFNLICLIN